MDPEENANIDDVLEDDSLEETPEDAPDDTDWKAIALKNQGIAKRLQTKLAKAGEKPKEEAPAKVDSPKTNELDETQLDYLDLKGISDQEDIDVIQKIVQKTGMTVRQALKDDYVVTKLDANRVQRAVKNATPGSQKRSGNGASDDMAIAIAKYDADGTLPEDFALRSAVVNAITDRSSTNKPAWAK